MGVLPRHQNGAGYVREQVSKGKYVWVCKLPSEHDPDVVCDLHFTAKTNRKHLFEEHRLVVHGVAGELPGLQRGPPSTFSSIDDKKAAKNLAQKKYAEIHKDEIVARREQKKLMRQCSFIAGNARSISR